MEVKRVSSIIFFAASIAGATYFEFKEATPKLWRYILPFIIALFAIALVATIIVIRRKPQATYGELGAPFVPAARSSSSYEEKEFEEDNNLNASDNSSDLERPTTSKDQVNQSGAESDNSQDDESSFEGSDFFTCRNVECKIFQNISLGNIEDKQEFIHFVTSILKDKFNSPRKRRRKGAEETFCAEEVDNLYNQIIKTIFTPDQMKKIVIKLKGKGSRAIRNKPAIQAIANALNLEQSSVSHSPS